MPDYKTPGVYIEEQPAVGPIAGVGTSTAAFIGPAKDGPINTPTKITNWTQFTDSFGGYYLGPPRVYLAYAVRGFFENGGTVAYIVRVSTAARAWLELYDRGTPPPPDKQGIALRIKARQEGPAGNDIKVTVTDAQIVGTQQPACALKATATATSASGNTITLATPTEATNFKPGDVVTIEGSTERVEIERISLEKLILATNLTASHSDATVRIADLQAGQKTFRVEQGGGLEPGSVIELRQGQTSENCVVDRVNGEFITLTSELQNTYTLGSTDPSVAITSYEFTLVINVQNIQEKFEDLSMDPRHSRYFGRVVDSKLVNVSLPETPSVEPPPNNRPQITGSPSPNLADGAREDLKKIFTTHYVNALSELAKVDDVNLVCVPDRTDLAVQQAVVAHCEFMKDRFAILDSIPRGSLFEEDGLMGQRAALESERGYAALYYPWISINDPSSPTGDETLLVPPSGHLAGIFARSDTERGVHKAPANELIWGAVGLQRSLTDADQGELNEAGVNVLRLFPGKARPTVWGARTTAPKDKTAYRYVNVRRLLLFVEESLEEGLRWAVFEPNDLGLWKKLDRTITEFLTRVWRSGALFGATAAQAFYVKIDEELNPPSVRNLGQVIIEIGIAPVRPAEIVIVRIGLWDGGSQRQES